MDHYIVSARKYRPGKFSDVVGQAAITRTLKNAIKNDHLGHAYLFCGPRGVGKTTCARIFAKTINCARMNDEAEPCNECESCRSFNESRAFNIHELDAASNNSVEDIRSLTEKVRIPPQVGRYSIYIIDEVHMLSAQAFNAFLKTLEEPPAHAVFILATTEKHKIIPTILSRCQIFDFNRIRVEDIVAYLEYIAKEEKVEYEPDALNVIALKADGAMRDALSIFDQIVSFTGRQLRYAHVIENLNILDYEYYFTMTGHFLERDVPAAFLLFNEILGKGFDAHNFLAGISSHMRDLLVCRDPVTLELLEAGAGIRDRYMAQSRQTSQEWLYRALEVLGAADMGLRTSRNQRLHVELCLLKLCNLPETDKKKAPQQDKPQSEAQESKASEPGHTVSDGKSLKAEQQTTSSTPSQEKKIPGPIPSIKDALNGTDTVEEKAGREGTGKKEHVSMSKSFTQEDLLEQWNAYAEKIRPEKPRMANSLKHHLPVLKEGHILEVVFSNSTQIEQFDREIRQDLMEFLEASLRNNLFRIEPVVSETEQKQNNLYTPEQKYDHMLKKNPNLGKLKKRFNLDFE